jgi:NAD(P)-dependent dehydrogenase (short-subunit alcohol dehydrogenase family)
VAAFANAGYRVIATDTRARPVDLACFEYIQADARQIVDNAAAATEIFARVAALVGENGLEVLVNNAATQILGGTATLGREDWRATLEVNLLAPFFWVQGLADCMERAHGTVVNVSSIHARLTKRNFVAYATSKAALSAMTRAMAVDLGARIRIVAVEPAAIATEMLEAGFRDAPELYERLNECHPVGRISSPPEVADFILAIARWGSRVLQGAVIPLDGGIGAVLHDPSP